MASWISVAASGARIIMASMESAPPRRSLPPAATAKPSEHFGIPEHATDHGDGAGQGGHHGAGENVAILHVPELVRQHTLNFLVVADFQNAARHRHRGVAGIAARGKRVGRIGGNKINLGNRDVGLGGQALDNLVNARAVLARNRLARPKRPARSCRRRNNVPRFITAAITRARISPFWPPHHSPMPSTRPVMAASKIVVLKLFHMVPLFSYRPPIRCLQRPRRHLIEKGREGKAFSWNDETHSGVRNPRSQFFRSSLVHLSRHEAGSRRNRQRKAERVARLVLTDLPYSVPSPAYLPIRPGER